MTGSADPAGLFTVAARNALEEFAEPRIPNVWAGQDGLRDLATMSRVAFLDIPELTRRFETDLGPFIDRIHTIGQPPLRLVKGGRAA